MFPHHSPSQHSEASLQPVHLSTSPLAGFFFFFLASCITANGEIEIKIRTTARLQIAICGIWFQTHQGESAFEQFWWRKGTMRELVDLVMCMKHVSPVIHLQQTHCETEISCLLQLVVK